ncbi:MAG: hypothetical protein V3T30_00320 [Thermodesulfobacteriota bacterium]
MNLIPGSLSSFSRKIMSPKARFTALLLMCFFLVSCIGFYKADQEIITSADAVRIMGFPWEGITKGEGFTIEEVSGTKDYLLRGSTMESKGEMAVLRAVPLRGDIYIFQTKDAREKPYLITFQRINAEKKEREQLYIDASEDQKLSLLAEEHRVTMDGSKLRGERTDILAFLKAHWRVKMTNKAPEGK